MSDTSPVPTVPPVAVTPPTPWWVRPGLAALMLVIFGAATAAACFLGNETLLTTMFTATVTMTGLAIGFFFNSSASSDKKDDTIAANTAALAASSPSIPQKETP